MTQQGARQEHVLSKRQAARIAAVQALYQMELTAANAADVIAEFSDHRLPQLLEPLGMNSPSVDAGHFGTLIEGIATSKDALDAMLSPHLAENWTLHRCGYLLRACLRAAAFELSERRDVPPKVAIHEYVKIGEMFLGKGQAGMINAVLDRLARQLQPEMF